MDKKTLLLINGVSTVGKTTLSQKLLDNNQVIHPICNYTTRKPRYGDDPKLVWSFCRKYYDKIEGFVSDEGGYKIALDDISYFIAETNKSVAITNSAFSTVPQVKNSKFGEQLIIKSCLIRFCDDSKKEKEILAARIENRFHPDREEIEKRISLFTEMIDKYTHNQDFLKDHVDLIITHEKNSARSTYQTVSNFLNLK